MPEIGMIINPYLMRYDNFRLQKIINLDTNITGVPNTLCTSRTKYLLHRVSPIFDLSELCSDFKFPRLWVIFMRSLVFYYLYCQIIWILVLGILLWDPMDLGPWLFVLSWDFVDLASSKFVSRWDHKALWFLYFIITTATGTDNNIIFY